MKIVHSPIGALGGVVDRVKLAASMALHDVPEGTRTDLGGIAIELLPPRLRDHMPDRYCAALSQEE